VGLETVASIFSVTGGVSWSDMLAMDFETLKHAVCGGYAAIRRISRLEPQGEKVFPPTYESGIYATESRQVRDENGQIRAVDTVLLDSVQSQANRLELALLRACQMGRVRMPLLQVDFTGDGSDAILTEIGSISTLEAPHRIYDAIFRDSMRNGKPFRESDLGLRLNSIKVTNATALFEMCPTALLFGCWDSTGRRGGLGAKLQRALVSEIVGYDVVPGKRSSSRIDPLEIETNLDIFAKEDGGWTFNESEAARKNGRPIKRRPSEINHGNITPSLKHEDTRTLRQVLNHGGVTISHAIQHTVLSLAALRKLRFPIGDETSSEIDDLARTVLAALGLTAICCLDEDGYDLRSRCLLDGKPGTFEFVGRGETKPFETDLSRSAKLLADAVQFAKSARLPWPEEPVTLQPSENLRLLVSESRKRSIAASTGE
jgi:CRISPR-associated protein Csb1